MPKTYKRIIKKSRRKKRLDRERLDTPTPVIDSTPDLKDTKSPENIIKLQQTIGNQATRQLIDSNGGSSSPSDMPSLVMRTPQVSESAPNQTVQRSSLEDLQAQLESAKEAFARKKKGSKAWNQFNNKIKRLEGQISELQSSAPESTSQQETKSEPFKKKYPALANAFTEDEIQSLETSLSEERLNSLLEEYDGSKIKSLITELEMDKFTDMVTTFPNNKLSMFTTIFTTEQMKDLLTVYKASSLNAMFGKIHPNKIKDILGSFTATEFKDFTATVGQKKVIKLVNVHELTGEVLKHYSAEFFKDFIGAGSDTMHHLLTVRTKNDGTISGGHDAAVFYPELNKKVGRIRQFDSNNRPYWVDVPNGQVTSSTNGSNFDKVYYDTYRPNGNYRASGSKTLIHDLQSQQNVWLKRASEAVWESIKNKTFPENGGAWSGASSDGVNLRGFYTPSVTKTQIATFFPV